MRWIPRYGAVAAVTALAVVAGCGDDIPTLSEAGVLAPGSLPITLEHVFESGDVVLGSFVVNGETDIDDASYLLAANRFDGSLDAHVLARFRQFPDTLVLGADTDTVFDFLDSEVVGIVSDTLQVSDPIIDYQLWAVTQPWDSISASWLYAINRDDEQVPWVTPGGTRGELLGTQRWERADATAAADSLVWTISADVTRRLASGEIPGLMVTLAAPGTLAQVSALVVRAAIQPKVRQDTVVTRLVAPGPHRFIFDPDPPPPGNALSVGGLTSDRSSLTLEIGSTLPACAPPVAGACATRVSPTEVALNRVELLLDPVPVPDGYRPVAPYRFLVRRVFEPELGERAPLGPIIAEDTVLVAQATGASSEPVRVNLTRAVEAAFAEERTQLAIALLVEPEASRFAYAWFTRTARLRFIYTLPQQPQLP